MFNPCFPLRRARHHDSEFIVDLKEMTTPKDSCNTMEPENTELFHSTKRPPEAPQAGTQTKRSNLFGANLRKVALSKEAILVSCKHIIEAELSSIFCLSGGHLSSPFKPRMFQHKIFQSLIDEIKVDIRLEQQQVKTARTAVKAKMTRLPSA